jgi:AraC family transcriptional regulator, ethanolamine operon transcriptional activator
MIKVSHFSDAQQHGDAISGWRNRYYQLTPGKLDSLLTEVAVTGMHVFSEYFTHEMAQYGTAPNGAVSFAIPTVEKDEPTHIEGRPTSAWLYAISNGAEYTLHSVGCADTLVLVVDNGEWRDALQAALPTLANRTYPGGPVQCDVQAYPEATRRLRQQFEAALSSPLMFSVPGVHKVFRDSMLCTLLDLRPGETDNRTEFLNRSVRAEVVRRSRDLVLGAQGEPVTVLDLCRACRLSRRAIQTSFLRETGVTPLVYMRALRLNEVRTLLMTSAREELPIGEAAARFAFYHLSHFATDYRALFGELPSETPRHGGRARHGQNNQLGIDRCGNGKSGPHVD